MGSASTQVVPLQSVESREVSDLEFEARVEYLVASVFANQFFV